MALPKPAPGTGKWWVVGTIGITLGVLAAIWFGLSATKGLAWSDAGHNVVSDARVDVIFDVTNQGGRPVRCTLEALDNNHGQVGVLQVDLPASDLTTTRYTRSVATVSRAVAATVDSCEYR
ncbi:DUF4307 domain-containing protein [Branchiibius cervicis]|uniref:DUF4307 domain-containing protein n=1 Tax=Branchiibius cervicis TaxID=908252 RepID=A0ABW2AVR9_9MICO